MSTFFFGVCSSDRQTVLPTLLCLFIYFYWLSDLSLIAICIMDRRAVKSIPIKVMCGACRNRLCIFNGILNIIKEQNGYHRGTGSPNAWYGIIIYITDSNHYVLRYIVTIFRL